MPTKDSTIDEYLSALSDDQRSALQRLREQIHSIAPRAEECISYQLPGFRLDGRLLVSFGAGAKHCAFYPASGTAVAAHEVELDGYETSKGAIRFSPERPLPLKLVRMLVKYRIAENAARAKSKGSESAVKRTRSKSKAFAPVRDESVDAFMRDLEHPLKEGIDRVREIILGVNPEIREGIKWNAPTFRLSDDFATIHLREKRAVQVILHFGAKVKDLPAKGMTISDPKGLIKWLAKDRCLVTLGADKEIGQNRAAFASIIREWIALLGSTSSGAKTPDSTKIVRMKKGSR